MQLLPFIQKNTHIRMDDRRESHNGLEPFLKENHYFMKLMPCHSIALNCFEQDQKQLFAKEFHILNHFIYEKFLDIFGSLIGSWEGG